MGEPLTSTRIVRGAAAVVLTGSLTLLVAAACSPESQLQASQPTSAEGPFRVLSVTDGDTIRVSVNGQSTRVRLIRRSLQVPGHLPRRATGSPNCRSWTMEPGHMRRQHELTQTSWLDPDKLASLGNGTHCGGQSPGVFLSGHARPQAQNSSDLAVSSKNSRPSTIFPSRSTKAMAVATSKVFPLLSARLCWIATVWVSPPTTSRTVA